MPALSRISSLPSLLWTRGGDDRQAAMHDTSEVAKVA